MDNINYIIHLSGEDSERFYYDMTHVDQENQNRINAFFREIDESISLSVDGDRILAEAAQIDMKSILDLLETDTTCKENVRKISESVMIVFEKHSSVSSSTDDRLVNGKTTVDLRIKKPSYENPWIMGVCMQSNVDLENRLLLIA